MRFWRVRMRVDVKSAVSSSRARSIRGAARGAYLHGSFGSGRSHFLAMLYAERQNLRFVLHGGPLTATIELAVAVH